MEKALREETEYLEKLIAVEDLAEKKTKIYSRLLMESNFAKKMEESSVRHAERKKSLEELLYGENKTKKGGMYAMNGEGTEK